MRITFLISQSLESPSGLGRYWPVAKELQRLGHHVTILALHHDLRSLTERRLVRDGVDIWYVGQMHVRKIGDTKLYYGRLALLLVVARATLGLLWGALRVPADVYHVCKPHPMNAIAGFVASRLRRKPLYLDCDDYEAGSNRFSSESQRRVVAFFEDRLPRYASGITTNTRFSMQRLLGLGYPKDRIFFVPNGVDRDRFGMPDPSHEEQIRRELDIGDASVVLYLGSMSLASHAVDLLVDAVPAIVASCNTATLLLVGGGEDLKALRDQADRSDAGRHIRFVGRVPPDQALAYYHLARVVVDPVRDDLAARARSPLKIVEALACGVPVVTGDLGDRREMLREGALGSVAVPGSVADLAQKVVALLKDPDRHTRMSRAALEQREEWYWDRLVRAFAVVYDAR